MTQIHGRVDTEEAMKTTVSEVSSSKDSSVLLILASNQHSRACAAKFLPISSSGPGSAVLLQLPLQYNLDKIIHQQFDTYTRIKCGISTKRKTKANTEKSSRNRTQLERKYRALSTCSIGNLYKSLNNANYIIHTLNHKPKS